MKMRTLCLLPVFFLLAGCASSERMNRMSGGVFQEYSAPKSYRIRSQKFQAKSRRLESGRTDRIGQVENAPVNVWPFCFSSDYYTAILWPFIDWDDYGFAVRPFYNQEGDERAVLFPLSAWNPANGDGWVLLAAWNTTGFGFIPLCWQNRDKDSFWYYYTPLLIHSEETRPLTLRNKYQDSFTWLLLGYFKGEKRVNRKFRAFRSSVVFSPAEKRKLAYMLDGTGVKVPSSQPELDNLLRDPEAVKKLSGSEKNSFGVVPLFHVTDSSEKTWWRALAYLVGGESSEKYWGWDVLGPFLAKYHDKAYDWHLRNHDRLFVSVPLMTYFADKILLRNTGKGKAVRQLVNYVSWREDPAAFRKKIPKINAELKKLDPAWKLPATVMDDAIYRVWLEDFFRTPGFRALKLETRHNRHGGFLPLFWYETTEDPDSAEIFSFAGMTRYYRRGDEALSFWSVPLLTYRSREKYRTGKKVRQEKEAFRIAPPLIWYSDMKSKFSPEQHPILPSTARRAGKYQCSVRQDEFSALGLYYHGKMAFYAAKPGENNKILEDIRQNLPRLAREANSSVIHIRKLKKDISGLQAAAERERQIASKPGQNKIRLYEKLLDYEKKKLALEKAEQEYGKVCKKIAGLEKKAASIGFKFDVNGMRQGRAAAADSALEQLFARYTEKRWQEDYGSGLFYRKEIFHNGDFHWRLLGILAGGEKNGNREHCHVLQFLYRYRRDGRKLEKIYFPFVSIRENGADRRFSFLGRIYQKTVKNGRTSGYVLFIPF
jgi:hypothetical protein